MTTGGEGVDQAGAQSVYERFSTPDDIWSYVEGVFRQYPHNWVVAEQYPDLRDNMAYLDKLVWGSADEGVVVLETGLGGDYQRYHDLACYGQFEEGVPPALRRHARLSERFEYVGGPTKSSQDIAVQKLSRPPFFDRYTVTPYEIPVIIEAIGEPLGTEEATLLLASMESARQTNQQKRELVGMEAVASVTEQVEALRAQAQPTRERYTQKRAEIAAANVRITEAQAELRQLEEEAWMLGQHLKPHERRVSDTMQAAREPAIEQFNSATLQRRRELAEAAENQNGILDKINDAITREFSHISRSSSEHESAALRDIEVEQNG